MQVTRHRLALPETTVRRVHRGHLVFAPGVGGYLVGERQASEVLLAIVADRLDIAEDDASKQALRGVAVAINHLTSWRLQRGTTKEIGQDTSERERGDDGLPSDCDGSPSGPKGSGAPAPGDGQGGAQAIPVDRSSPREPAR